MRLLKFALILVLQFASFNSHAIEQQRALNWCWAASMQDVIAQAGIFERQDQIAARLTGWPQDRPAYIDELVALAQSYGLTAWRAGYPGSPQELFNTLLSGWKLIAFVKPSNGPVGHYIVLEGVDPFGNIVTADPATGVTQPISLQALYFGWRWVDSVVIGKPLAISDSNSNNSASDDWDACYDRCQSRMDRCTDRCSLGSSWDRCYDRCQSSNDRCVERCSR